MDREALKRANEEHWVLEAARWLGADWVLRPRLHPDFLIDCPTGNFGLEVTECYVGGSGRGGSSRKEGESHNHRWLSSILERYQKRAGVEISVKYLGPNDIDGQLELEHFLEESRFDQLQEFEPRYHRSRLTTPQRRQTPQGDRI
jgi:hypothetical protein